MEKKERTISVFAISDYGTTVQITMTEEVDDLTDLINKAIDKIKEFKKKDETLKIVHIDSMRKQKTPEL
jgi:ABC-type amino acid transport substrate-binding protein